MVHQAADGEQHHTAPMLFGLRAVMLGRQGSGKGTQGVQLARLLVVPHISVGDVLREAVRSGSPAGRRAQETMERGELVDGDLVVSLVAERLAEADVRSGGFVLDGFPRTTEQAVALAGMLADGTLDRAVVIDVPLEVARARLLARRVCTGCGRIYSVKQARGLEEWTCGACGGLVRRRADDSEEAVTRRLALYDEQTRPLLDWFGRRDQLLLVNGVGTSEDVFTRLLAGLWPRIPTDRIAQLAGVSEPVPTEPASSPADEDVLAVEVVIEVPRGSRNKYEFDHERHVLHLDRRLFSATVYPADYGFVPDTLAEDGDPLDALVLLEEPVFPGCWVQARPIGIFWMEDEKGPDAKIICVPLGDPRWDQVRDLDDMPTHLRSEIHHFFDVYKALEPGKSTSTTGFEGREAALGEIAASRARLEHRQRTGESQEAPREAVPAVGGLLVDAAARGRPERSARTAVKVRRSGGRGDFGPSCRALWPVFPGPRIGSVRSYVATADQTGASTMTTLTEPEPTATKGPLQDRVALVTGGTRGIGAAISHRLAADGAHVAAGYWRQHEAAEKFTDSMNDGYPGTITVHHGNIGEPEDCRRVVREVIEHHGRLDILVNNAGITIDRTVAKMGDEDWLRVISINLSGAFFVAQAALEHMLARGTGRIINVSSVIGETGNIGQANYAASKSGLFGLTKSLAREAVFMLNRSQLPAGDGPGLTVNGVTPGYIATDMLATIPDKVMERIRGQIPVGRLGKPEEIARVVAFLAADESSYVTGQIWAVNGGLDM